MIDEPSWPLSEDTQAEDQRRCVLCAHFFPKDEMERRPIDEPGAYDWVCEDCYERGQSERYTCPPNHPDE